MCDHDSFFGFSDFKVFHEASEYFQFLLLFAAGDALLAHAAQGVTVCGEGVYVEGIQVIHGDAFGRSRQEQVVLVYVIVDVLARWQLHNLDLWQRGVHCGVVDSVIILRSRRVPGELERLLQLEPEVVHGALVLVVVQFVVEGEVRRQLAVAVHDRDYFVVARLNANGLGVIPVEGVSLAAEELRRADEYDALAPLRDQLGHRRVRRHVARLQPVLGTELEACSTHPR